MAIGVWVKDGGGLDDWRLLRREDSDLEMMGQWRDNQKFTSKHSYFSAFCTEENIEQSISYLDQVTFL